MITVLSLILQKYICIYIHIYFFGELRVNLLVFSFSHWQNVCVYLSFCCVFCSFPLPLPPFASPCLGVAANFWASDINSSQMSTKARFSSPFGTSSLLDPSW